MNIPRSEQNACGVNLHIPLSSILFSARFGALQAGGQGQVKLHCLEQAGHWIHVDDLEGVLRLLAPTFLPPL
jgi:hypothetical protein